MAHQQVVVVGAGIIGLTTALGLQEAGYPVQLLAAEGPEQSNSMAAGAIWTPYLTAPADKVAGWSKASFDRYCAAAAAGLPGVSLVWLDTYRRNPALPDWLYRLPTTHWRQLSTEEVPSIYRGGFRMLVPLIEPGIYLPYLFQCFLGNGGTFEQRRISTLEELPPAAFTINCTGLGARKLVPDSSVYPVKGQLLLLEKKETLPYYVDDEFPETLSYVFTRTDGILIGGSAEPGVEDQSTQPELLATIRRRCEQILPELRGLQVLRQWAGHRPARPEIRLEREADRTRIHNYGHGGAGYTLAWGCASSVVELLGD